MAKEKVLKQEEIMYGDPKYTIYRNKRIPGWWETYLPNERNPYQEKDTLTLEKGCLANYWHIHSSNKHPNYSGAKACNLVHEKIYERFGGAFLTSSFRWIGGRKGEITYHEPEHLIYKNAYLGEDGNIHIKNAKQYYEDVIIFVQNVLQEIAKNHLQSGNDYGARDFFPYFTDAEIEKRKREAEEQRIRVQKIQRKLEEYVAGSDFYIERIEFEKTCFSVAFDDMYDGWYGERFTFGKISTNIEIDDASIVIAVDVPHMFYSYSTKKDPQLATKTLEMKYCLYLMESKDMEEVIVAIPKEKVADSIKEKINAACNQAMEAYNRENADMIENMNVMPTYRYYPHNFFLENKIGRLDLVYKEGAGTRPGSWRMWQH